MRSRHRRARRGMTYDRTRHRNDVDEVVHDRARRRNAVVAQDDFTQAKTARMRGKYAAEEPSEHVDEKCVAPLVGGTHRLREPGRLEVRIAFEQRLLGRLEIAEGPRVLEGLLRIIHRPRLRSGDVRRRSRIES